MKRETIHDEQNHFYARLVYLKANGNLWNCHMVVIIVGLPYNIKGIKVTVVVIWCFIDKTELI